MRRTEQPHHPVTDEIVTTATPAAYPHRREISRSAAGPQLRTAAESSRKHSLQWRDVRHHLVVPALFPHSAPARRYWRAPPERRDNVCPASQARVAE